MFMHPLLAHSKRKFTSMVPRYSYAVSCTKLCKPRFVANSAQAVSILSLVSLRVLSLENLADILEYAFIIDLEHITALVNQHSILYTRELHFGARVTVVAELRR